LKIISSRDGKTHTIGIGNMHATLSYSEAKKEGRRENGEEEIGKGCG
jgi:hypothetical protein